MRRAPLVITATLAGLAGVLTFHTRHSSTLATAAPSTPAGASGGRHRSSSGTTPAPTSSPGSASPSSSAAGPATTAGAPAAGTRTVTGPLEQYGYGELSVKVTASGGRITAVSLASLTTAESYSQSIAEQVTPTLAHEILAAGSARVQGISGATYTSEAYAASAQAAIDSLHLG